MSDKKQIMSDNLQLWASLADILNICDVSFFFKIGYKLIGVWKTILKFVVIQNKEQKYSPKYKMSDRGVGPGQNVL